MRFSCRLRFRNHQDCEPNLFPNPQRPQDNGLISLSHGGDGSVGDTFEDEDGYFTAASSSWSSSSQGRVDSYEITINEVGNCEIEDTASTALGSITPQDDDNSKEDLSYTTASVSMAMPNGAAAEKNRISDCPPTDDCCPICFSGFSVPVRAPCGHWYCGGCILQYWEYGPALQPCRCPMCSQKINNLIPGASLGTKQEPEVAQVLKNVRRYNRLFVGGLYGSILRLLDLPLCIKRVFQDMINPDQPGAHLNKLRTFAIFLGFLYTFSPFDFLRIGRKNVVDLFDYSAIVLSLVFYVVGVFLRRRRFQRVRAMAAVQL